MGNKKIVILQAQISPFISYLLLNQPTLILRLFVLPYPKKSYNFCLLFQKRETP